MTAHDTSPRPGRRRSAPLLWLSGALAAAVLVLGVTGTLSAWTSAIIANDQDTVAAQDTLVLKESDGTSTCISTDNSDGTNSYTCSTINKYGGTAVPLDQGTDQSQAVTLTNTGTATGDLTLAIGACTKSAGSPTASEDICDVATVTIVCTAPSALDTTATPVALSSFGNQTVATLDPGESTDCTFDVALQADASPQIGGQVASQPLTWTLA